MTQIENSTIIAENFVKARRAVKSLQTYPGMKPSSLEEAYDIQDKAIALWGEHPAGWKVGRIVGDAAVHFGTDRLVGPVFPEFLWAQNQAPHTLEVFEGGFAAVEGEVVAVLGKDAPADKYVWTAEDALSLVASLHAGVEIASSPYAGINLDGPLVTISDFGNNRGLIIGDEIPNWRLGVTDDWLCQTFIDDQMIAEKAASAIPGGPIESLRYLLENTAKRGLALKKGTAVCTGAVTGVHEIAIGQKARISFKGTAPINLAITGPR